MKFATQRLNTSTIETLKSHANIDYFYGPYDSDAEAIEACKDVYEVGLTVGIYTDENHVKVKEKWFQIEGGQYVLVDKTEEYELVLNYFEAVAEEDRIRITYEIGGKGLLPKVSISGTTVQSEAVNFNDRKTVYVDVSVPKVYYFRISVSDVLGTYFNSNGLNTTIGVPWGDIIVRTTNTSYVNNVLPQQSSYENKPIGIEIEYNVDRISNIQVCLFADDQLKYTFPAIQGNNGKITSTIIFPTGDYYGHTNVIYATYTEDSVSKRKAIYSFDILLPGEFALSFPKGFPTVGYSGSSLPITVNLQYGGKPQSSSEIIRSRIIEVTLDNGENLMNFEVGVNTTLELAYILPELSGNQESVTKTLKVKLDNNIYQTGTIEIRQIESPLIPSGTYYFNSSKQKSVVPNFGYPYTPFNLSIPELRQPLVWSSETEEVALNIPFPYFNIDFNINYSQSGEDLPLIIIKQGNKNLLTVGKQKITSDLFSVEGKTYQTNGLSLPQDNQDLHIGFGYQRAYTTGKYYSCIFINGEIAFCSETSGFANTGAVELRFNNSFTLYELCLSLAASASGLVNCVSAGGGIPLNEYKLIEGSQYDVFYYNWLTTLPLDYQVSSTDDLLKLQLIPFGEPETPDVWWQSLRSSLGTFGSNIKATDSKRKFKEFKFVKFGKINHGTKAGITVQPKLFEFLKSDKETEKLDKLCGVICKYKFVKGANITFSENKYCIVQVQGTSTLAYPVPNFQFTFIKYIEGEGFSLDEDVQLNYLSPVFEEIINNEETELTFETKQVLGETNLVAKADSMDSAHLNNTPTCVYFNSLVNTLAEDNFGGNFQKFDIDYLDAIVGTPILLEIDSNESINNNDRNVDVNTVQQFDSYGTFMFNTGKSAKCMGLSDNENKVFSLEGQSNEESDAKGAAGLFTLPNPEIVDDDYETNQQITNAFNKLQLVYGEDVTVDDSNVSESEKSLIINYLINDTGFESRSTIDDDDITDTDNWSNYALPILRMWLFVNRAEGTTAQDNFPKYFDKVFNKDYAILYYIDLLLFGQADNLGKNMMLDCKYGENIWYIRPYDLDSEFGLTNNGFDDFPVYACISEQHFQERFIETTYTKIAQLPEDTFTKYNSKSSKLWTKFWAAFKEDIRSYYNRLRTQYVTPDRMVSVGKGLVNNMISKEQYNIDFSLKHLGTEYSYLNKGGRFLNYKDWITKRFMYVDSYFSYFKVNLTLQGYNGFEWTINKTLIPIFYEANYQKLMTRYGYEDWTYGEPMSSNMQYEFQIVPEAVLSMSPIWGNLVQLFNAGVFKNIQKYSGVYNPEIFTESDKFNLREIEILESGNKYNIGTTALYIPKSVRVLKLQNLSNAQDAIQFLNIQSDGGLEELYIHNCDISNLSIDSLSQLKVLEITSGSDVNYSSIGTLTLNNLALSRLKIGAYTRIENLNILGQTTLNNYIDLSGINCQNLVFSNSTVEELHIDQLYNFNGTPYSGYDFGSGTLFRLSNGHPDYPNARYTNIEKLGNEGYEYVYFNRTNCNRIIPYIGTSSLDLTNCTNLKTFSCIGNTNLQSLNLPTSVKCLNLQYCKNLKRLNCSDSNPCLDFSGFSGLYCNTDYGILRLTYYSGNVSAGYPSFTYYIVSKIGMTSFNLLGCYSVEKIKNLTNNSVSNFNGSYFVAGCESLVGFEDCDLTFTNLSYSFRMTTNLLEVPSSFNFSLRNGSSATSAFGGTGADIESILNALKDVQLNATNMFSGVQIKQNIGTEQSPITLQWTNCESLFTSPRYTWSSIGSSVYGTSGSYDYEQMTLSTQEYAHNGFVSDENIYHVYIRLPRASGVTRMFMSQKIIVENVNTIFTGNTSLTTAHAFVANTEQNKLIDFTPCTRLSVVRYCYSNTKIPQSEMVSGCKLPTSVTNVVGLFREVDLLNFDVRNIFSGLNNITDARAAFMNTKCDCSGSPFGSTGTRSINISSLFGSSGADYNYGTISDLSWITQYMTTGNQIPYNYSSDTIVNSVGVFEGKIIDNFQTVNGNPSSQIRMFRFANILSFDSSNSNQEFMIKGINSSQIFEGASIVTSTTSENPTNLKIDNNVENLTKAFMDANIGVLDIELENSNNISNLSYFLSGAVGVIRLSDNKTEDYNFFPRLTNISHMFDMSPLNRQKPEPRTGLGLNLLPDYLFKNATSLTNMDYFYKDVNISRVSEFKFTNCSNINTMNFAFANSAIEKIPEFNSSLNSLISMKGAFRHVTLVGNNSLTITAPVLADATEVFAQSTCNTNVIITMTCSKLKDIGAFSTSTNIDLSLNNTYYSISALLPNIANTHGGDLIIRGAGADIESQNTITYTYTQTANISWNSIDTQRQTNVVSNAFYSLAGDADYKYLKQQ